MTTSRFVSWCAVAAGLALAACQGRESPYGTAPQNPAASPAPAPVAQNLVGTFADTLPCADCPGILTELTLNADSTYVLRETYLGKNNNQPLENRRSQWRVRGQVLTLPPNGDNPVRRYLVAGPNQLRLLDRDGHVIESHLDYSLERR